MSSWILALVVGMMLGAGVQAALRGRRPPPARRVELPNSQYSCQGVRNQEARERWGRINQRRLHPLNRDEVQRLLDLVDRHGIQALSSKDKAFLDNMTLPRMG